jgi:hypothetical protein
MIGISVKADVARTVRGLKDIANSQLPYAIKLALDDVAEQAKVAERANIQKVFKHPRPFTVNAPAVTKATKKNLMAVVYVRDKTAIYLEPYEFGGVHVLPGTALLNPKDIRLDQYGQLTKGTPARLKGNPAVFVATIKGITGFWQRYKVRARDANGRLLKKNRQGGLVWIKKVKLLIRFGDALPVKEHLDFRVRALAVVKANFVQAFKAAVAKTIATARTP